MSRMSNGKHNLVDIEYYTVYGIYSTARVCMHAWLAHSIVLKTTMILRVSWATYKVFWFTEILYYMRKTYDEMTSATN